MPTISPRAAAANPSPALPAAFLARIADHPWLTWASWAYAGYLLTLPLKNTNALNHLCLVVSFLLWGISLARETRAWPRVGRGAWCFGVYALLVITGIPLSGIDVGQSWDRVFNGLAEQLYGFLFVLYYLRQGGSPRFLLAALASGFVLLTVAVLAMLAGIAAIDPRFLGGEFHLRNIAPGFGIHAQFYLPLLIGMVVTAPAHRLRGGFRWAILALAATGFALALAYGTMSGVALIVAYVLWLGWRRLGGQATRRWRAGAAAGIVFVMALGLTLNRSGLEKVAHQWTYATQGKPYELLSLRVGIWAIALDCAADAPWHGYGYGQKKIALVCSDEKYLAPARAKHNPMAEYFRADRYGSIGFHNQYLENLFIGGWAGSLCWLGLFVGAIVAARRQVDPSGLLPAVVAPLLLIYLAAACFNGIWETQPFSKGLMVLLALAWFRGTHNNTTHAT
jgi:O-antigen ligase